MRSPCRQTHPLHASRAAIGLACILLATGTRGEVPEEASPAAGGAGIALDTATPLAAAARHRVVYVCLDGAIPMYTDRPCGTTAVGRTIAMDAPRSGEVATVTPPAPRAATRPRRLPVVEPGGPARTVAAGCDTLQRRLEAVDDRMRGGYSAREAARLWQRWRELRERLRTSRC